jgi:hypothetical protein
MYSSHQDTSTNVLSRCSAVANSDTSSPSMYLHIPFPPGQLDYIFQPPL